MFQYLCMYACITKEPDDPEHPGQPQSDEVAVVARLQARPPARRNRMSGERGEAGGGERFWRMAVLLFPCAGYAGYEQPQAKGALGPSKNVLNES